MLKRCLFCLAGFALFSTIAHSQALPTATRAGVAQVGLTYTVANPDYSQRKIQGMSIYGTFDFKSHFGVEAAYHDTNVITPDDFGETSLELGGRYVYRHGRYEPYARGMLGRANLKYAGNDYNQPYSLGYWEYSLGAGLDVRLGHHINLRAIDFEMQTWPTFSPNNLTPYLISVGAAYRLR